MNSTFTKLPDLFKEKIENIFCNVVEAQGAGISLLGRDLKIIWVNTNLSKILNLHYDPIGKDCREIFKCECDNTNTCSVMKALSSSEKQICKIHLFTEKGERKYIQNITIPLKDGKDTIEYLIKLSFDVTEQEGKIRQLSLLRKLSELMQGTLQVDNLLHLILTCVTAGTALGFNCARLFLVDKERNIVYGKMAVGPSSMEEAGKIWNEIEKKYEKLEDLIKASEDNYRTDTPLHMLTRLMVYSLSDEREIIVECVNGKKSILERNAFNNTNISKNFVSMIDADEFVCVPLMVCDVVIGVICADNRYNKKLITEEQVQLLNIFASRAAIMIENANAYKKLEEKISQLKETQDRLIRSERLAVIGNMSAYIAHEIRNPLVTVGGFARAILRDPHDENQIRKGADIIVEEVERLERFLANIMDFSKPIEPVRTVSRINEVLENTCALMEPYIRHKNIQLIKVFDINVPEIKIDKTQIKQVFLNLIKNAIESMPNGGTLTIETVLENDYVKINIADTGEGISAEVLQNIFVPFFTTKVDGTGVGLAVSHKIIDDHGGYINVKSLLKEGTTFCIYLPLIK